MRVCVHRRNGGGCLLRNGMHRHRMPLKPWRGSNPTGRCRGGRCAALCSSTGPKQGAVPLTREMVSAAVDARIKALFDRAADPATHLVTAASAENSGVGYFTGHFADMDRDSDGALSLRRSRVFSMRSHPLRDLDRRSYRPSGRRRYKSSSDRVRPVRSPGA